MSKAVAWVLVVLCAAGTVCGLGAAAAALVQTETDEYTRYELLSPESSSFAIRYEVTATTAGAKYFFNVFLQSDPQGQRGQRRVGS